MKDPQTLISTIEAIIRKQTHNWLGPWASRSIAEEIVSEITTEADPERLGAILARLGEVRAATTDETALALLADAEYAANLAESLMRERDEYVVALSSIVKLHGSTHGLRYY